MRRWPSANRAMNPSVEGSSSNKWQTSEDGRLDRFLPNGDGDVKAAAQKNPRKPDGSVSKALLLDPKDKIVL